SQRLAGQVDAVLRRAGIDTWLLDGTQSLALLWERLHPAAELTQPEQERLLERLAGPCAVAAATTLQEAAAPRRRTREVSGGPRSATRSDATGSSVAMKRTRSRRRP